MKVSDFKRAESLIHEMDRVKVVSKLLETGSHRAHLFVGGTSIEIEEISAYDAIHLRTEELKREMESIGLEYDK